MLELYCHDFSDFVDVEIGPDGRFGYEGLDRYWTDADRHPFLVTVDGRLAGFVLVDRIREGQLEKTTWDVAEFFILRTYRRRGIGTQVAHEVFRRLPGGWQIRVIEANQPACRFWKHVTSGFAGPGVRSVRALSGEANRQVFLFESRAGEGR